MKSTLARLKSLLRWRGKIRINWAEESLDEYVNKIEQSHPDVARQLKKTPFAKFNGKPHESERKADPFHASVALRRDENFKGSGVSFHVYPDGTVVPSKPEYPNLQTRPATKEELGKADAKWLNYQYVQGWVAAMKDKNSSKEKAKAESSKDSSSKRQGSSSSSSKGKAAEPSYYQQDPTTGALYRYAENGAVIYYDQSSQREFYYDANGHAVWL